LGINFKSNQRCWTRGCRLIFKFWFLSTQVHREAVCLDLVLCRSFSAIWTTFAITQAAMITHTGCLHPNPCLWWWRL
jgi:hypothetical protein